MKQSMYEFIIVGGGATGTALALMLAPLKQRVLLIEAQPQKQQADAADFDERAIALSYGSQRILQRLRIWPRLAADAMPIRHIHVSDRGHFGHSVLRSDDLQVPALGQVIPLRVLNSVLYQQVVASEAATVVAPATVIECVEHADRVVVTVAHAGGTQQFETRAVLAADGTQSALRQLAAIPIEREHYEQTAVIANVVSDGADFSYAYERFTASGPLALLPLTQQRWSLVWSLHAAAAHDIAQCPEPQFLHELQRAFGWRVGRFTRVGVRQTFALQRIVSAWRRHGRLLLLGNAAQQVHPIAGQGFNLALRDVDALAQALHAQPWSPALIQHFLTARAADQQRVLQHTDALVRLFSNDYPLLSPLRALALDALSLLPPWRDALARQAMGI
jgi:2-octaprenyl-6-methoxyphenol hydroxylase